MNKEIILQSIGNQSYILGLVFLFLILCAVLDKRFKKNIFVKIGIVLIAIAVFLVININLLLIELF